MRPHSHTSRSPKRSFSLFARPQKTALRGDEQQRGIKFLIPPPLFVILSCTSVQLGAAFAKSLFDALGAEGTVLLRLVFSALLLLLWWRPQLRNYSWKEYMLVACFGLAIAGLTAFFYISLTRVPLGIAVTISFIGPLGVALLNSRRLLDGLWTILAAAGIILLTPIGGEAVDPLGIVLSLLGGLSWGAYILLSVRVGRIFPGGSCLAIAMSVAALVLIPFGISGLSAVVHNPALLVVGLGITILSAIIPFSLELEALRQMPAYIFGVLMSLEPAIAALIGFIVLHEALSMRSLIAIVLVVVASGGASFVGNPSKKPAVRDESGTDNILLERHD